MYIIVFSQTAEKQFKKLNKEVQKRIRSSLKRIRFRPYSHIKKIIGTEYFSLRIGDYRLILSIQEGKLIILVIEIGHRKDIYKN